MMLNTIRRSVAPLLLLMILSGVSHAQESNKEIEALEQQLKQSKEDTSKVKLLIDLGNAYAYTDLDKSISYLKQGYSLSNKLHYPFGIARNAYLLGVSYVDASQYATADSFIHIAEQEFEKLGSIRDLAKVQNAWGSITFKQGNYWAAGSHFSKSAEMFDQIKDTAFSLQAYQNLIAILGRTRNYEKAVAQSKKILAIVELRKDSSGIAYALQGLITDLTYLKRFDEAFSYLKRALDLANSLGVPTIAAEIYSAVGGYYSARNNHANALNYFQTALDKAEKIGDPFQVANHHNSIGQCYYLVGNYAKAREHLLQGMELAKQYNNRGGIQNLALSLSSLYDSTRDYRKAYTYLLEHAMMKDSVLNSEIRNYTSNLEAQYESNKKENEILRLQQVETEKNYQINRRNATIIASAGLILALLVLFYLARRNFRNKQKLVQERSALLEERLKTMEKEKQISSLQSMVNGQETERTRVARDLHDGVGGLFSTVKMYYSSLHHETPEVKNNSLYQKTGDLINNAAEELRKVAHNMMPEVLMKMGLTDALKDLCNNISAGKNLQVRLEAYGMDKRLDGPTEIMLFRIVQELTNNIIKHATATEAVIQINQEDDRLSLVVEDNGKGFDVAQAEAKQSMGMATVRSRVLYLHGELSIDSQSDIGTTVTIEVPLNQ
jgi:two-component system NarL family sensor kinase